MPNSAPIRGTTNCGPLRCRLKSDSLQAPASMRNRRLVNRLSPSALLAWAFLSANPRRLAGALAGVAVSAALMQYQTSLILGFLNAAKAPIRGVGAELWLIPKGQPAFEYAQRLPRAYAPLVAGVPGVQNVSRIANAWASYRGPSGQLTLVTLVGVDGLRVSANLTRATSQSVDRKGLVNAVAFDRRDRRLLDVAGDHHSLEINGHRFVVVDDLVGYSTFLGPPYAFTDFHPARRAIGLGPEDANAIAIHLEPEADSAITLQLLRDRFPEVTVLSSGEYQAASSFFWLTRTGAGGGLMLSALLGFLVGLIVVSQTMFAVTTESRREFATLRAIGVRPRELVTALLHQATFIAVVGCAIGTAVAFVMAQATSRYVLGWIQLAVWIPATVFLICICMSFLASLSSVRALLKVQPAEAFRER